MGPCPCVTSSATSRAACALTIPMPGTVRTRVSYERSEDEPSPLVPAAQADVLRRQLEAGQHFRKDVEAYWEACDQWADAEIELPGNSISIRISSRKTMRSVGYLLGYSRRTGSQTVGCSKAAPASRNASSKHPPLRGLVLLVLFLRDLDRFGAERFGVTRKPVLASSWMKIRVHRLSDTSADAEKVLLDIYRRMPVWRKVELVEDANRTARRLAMVGLRSRHPEESLATLRRRLLGLVLGEETAQKIYGSPSD